MKQAAQTLFLFFLLLFAYTKFAGPIPFSVKSITSQKTDAFTVTGEGKAVVVPDIAVVTVGVQAQGTTVKQVQTELNRKTNAVISAVKKIGIDAKDIQTTNYTLSPTYDYQSGRERISGYTANSNLTIKVRTIDRANDVIDSATEAGANHVGGVSFEVEDKEKALNEAREKAVAAARKKAENAAKIAGFTLGRLVNYHESEGGGPRPIPLSAKAEDAAGGAIPPTQIEPGSSEIVVQVSLSYEIR